MDSTVNSHSKTVAPKQAERKKMRYSIRKVATVGATSAPRWYLGILGATQVKADQVTETAPTVATATTIPETSTASLTVASETATSVTTSEAVESSVAHSEVATAPVTETQPSKTTPSVVEDKTTNTVVTSSLDTQQQHQQQPTATIATVSATSFYVRDCRSTNFNRVQNQLIHAEVALKLTENTAANANL